MSQVFIPDNPPERTYNCPKCGSSLRNKRIGNSCSYWVYNASDGQEHKDCKNVVIPIALLGYKPSTKEKSK